MSWSTQLVAQASTHRVLLLCLDEVTSASLADHRGGPARFSLSTRHDVLRDLRPPCLCLVYLTTGAERCARLGIAKSKRVVTTLDSAIQVVSADALTPGSPAALIDLLSKPIFRSRLSQDMESPTSVLSEGVSGDLVARLAEIPANRAHLERLAMQLLRKPRLTICSHMQRDAVELALAAFGLDKHAVAASVAPMGKGDGSLQFYEIDKHLLEDNVIAHDGRTIPGFRLVKSNMTGHAVFVRGRERLDVYTANRTALEKALGVDLVYANLAMGNVVMLQYKMLESERTDDDDGPPSWVFRPDGQFYDEVARMTALRAAANSSDYRLNAEPFYFKFVKRLQAGAQGGIVLPLEHLSRFLDSDEAKGPKGGLRICYEGLSGRYLRETDFLGLVRSGYIGTHAEDTCFLLPLIESILEGKEALVYAVHRATSREHAEDREQ